MAGLVETGNTYRNRALSGLVSEAGVATERQLAQRQLTQQKDIAKQGSQQQTFERLVRTTMRIATAAFNTMGMTPKKDADDNRGPITGQYGQPTESMEGPVGPVQDD